MCITERESHARYANNIFEFLIFSGVYTYVYVYVYMSCDCSINRAEMRARGSLCRSYHDPRGAHVCQAPAPIDLISPPLAITDHETSLPRGLFNLCSSESECETAFRGNYILYCGFLTIKMSIIQFIILLIWISLYQTIYQS